MNKQRNYSENAIKGAAVKRGMDVQSSLHLRGTFLRSITLKLSRKITKFELIL